MSIINNPSLLTVVPVIFGSIAALYSLWEWVRKINQERLLTKFKIIEVTEAKVEQLSIALDKLYRYDNQLKQKGIAENEKREVEIELQTYIDNIINIYAIYLRRGLRWNYKYQYCKGSY